MEEPGYPKENDVSRAPNNNLEEDYYGCELICGTVRSTRRRVGCMQFLNNAKGAVTFLCFALFMEGLVNAGLFNAVISTIEKRFQIQSTESAVVASGFDIFTCLALLAIAFSGDRIFKPQWLGWGTFTMGLGCVLYALPHFTAPVYNPVSPLSASTCGMNETVGSCRVSNLRNYRYLFFFANGLIGLGSTPLFTIAITYIDENVKQKNSAIYGGIYYSMGAIGPAAGYLIGSALLSTYTYLNSTSEFSEHHLGFWVFLLEIWVFCNIMFVRVDAQSGDALWIGNWWIGFLVVGIFCMALSIFIGMFPRKLPGTSRYRGNRNSEVHRNKASVKVISQEEHFGKSWRDAPKIIWLLVTNLPYVSLTLSSCINYSFVYGFNTFGAKYIASVFGVTISMASLTFGVTAIFGAVLGQLVGGWVITKFKLTVEGILKFMIWCTVIAIVASIGFLMHCPNTGFVGPTLSLDEKPTAANCRVSCGCSADAFDPVCGSDEFTYFSPCFAGCRTTINGTHHKDCNCIATSESKSENSSGEATWLSQFAVKGECKANNCVWFGPFLAAVFIMTLFTIMKTTPNLQATIRCIPFNIRTTAVSLQRLVFTLLGTIPGRILTGGIIDKACISWSTECGSLGACRAYDTVQVSKYMTYLICAQMVLCLILQILTLCLYKPSNSDAIVNESNES